MRFSSKKSWKYLERKDFCLTFASAFENDCDKPNRQNETCFGYVMASNRIKTTNAQAKQECEELMKEADKRCSNIS